ncbi:MAG: Peptidyl-prolyl cis-trans isomerase PpiD [Myxococcaceae bacterium]|nr:Peptidyl-prolyl cis-trans isomerase PpiD [Myxococcaceae bacterium]
MENRGKSSWSVVVIGVAIAAVASACDDKPKISPATDVPSAAASASTAGSAPLAASASASSATPATVPDAIAAQHVLVAYKGADKAPKGITRSKAEAKKRADEVAAKAKSGADFSVLVAEYSDDPAAKERQGSLGKFTREKMAKPFSDAAFALAVGESSGAVETPFGFHVIKRNQ